ncbi:uncharacterized protein LOC128880495 [Hylaeus volcanicus]|uniref:uncharacterized protein LOC128880495 n=1 Tax=Hylaeus volcanicus TaxID=313075 RepID=UPI0023B88346|nr:uncharacterized protein LOC128880495 [Hylaeus volcanicus]
MHIVFKRTHKCHCNSINVFNFKSNKISSSFNSDYHGALETSTAPKTIVIYSCCIVKPQVTSDLLEATIILKLLSNDSVIFQSTHFTSLNILQLYDLNLNLEVKRLQKRRK